ncbi:MAG: 2-dehydropantoate 2-reductase N-terminal domain-containing protein, partial [Spirochaetales bacterium]|nr:2-dehydropantoate 2-reductase N-terminal domain-containing protein [Spirochaetales bacterium]
MYTYAVIGTGAIGGYYGARLAESGKDVQFLARSDADYIKNNGLRVTSPEGDISLDNVKVFKSTEEMAPVDVILVAIKTTANNSIPKLISPLAKKGTIILLLQNGLGMEEEVRSSFPSCHVIGGMCFICSQKREPGVITHMDYGAV